MFKRLIEINKSAQSFFLFGPRGTGKTTWLKTNYKEAIYLDLLESKLRRTLQGTPEKLDNYIPKDYKGWVVLDEVQKIPELLNEVHRLIENKKYKFILTGSSARSLRRKGVNLLAGRALTYYLYPLTASELGQKFDFTAALKFGQLPTVKNTGQPAQFLDSYIETYLQEEILQEGLTRNIGNFSRFLEIASYSQGAMLNVAQIAQEAQLERKTVENYFKILEDLLIAYRLPVFTKKAKRKLVVHNKFYFFDVGVFRALRPTGPLDSEAEIDGPALETLFLQEIKAVNDYLNLDYEIFYWRSVTGLEVDFILYGPKGLVAFEIKRKSNINNGDLGSLKAFLKDYPGSKCYLCCGVDKIEYRDDITIINIEEVLRNITKFL
jgi:predicted AAA+ superfamily ATPase